MRKDNPAIYECPKGKAGIHHWERNYTDGTATCAFCNKHINKRDADDVWREQ